MRRGVLTIAYTNAAQMADSARKAVAHSMYGMFIALARIRLQVQRRGE